MNIVEINGIAVLDCGDHQSKEAMERGLCSDLMVRDILPLLKPGDWVVDGGAALGDHTVAYLDAVGETGQVFAFEPEPHFFQCLRRNCPKAISINRFLWNEADQFYIHSGRDNVGGSYLSKKSEGSDVVSGPISTVRLDDWGLDKLDYIKLDIEGAELFAMRGMAQTVARCRPKFVIEINPGPLGRFGLMPSDIYCLLEQWGYDHRSIRNDPGKYCNFCDILAWPM